MYLAGCSPNVSFKEVTNQIEMYYFLELFMHAYAKVHRKYTAFHNIIPIGLHVICQLLFEYVY